MTDATEAGGASLAEQVRAAKLPSPAQRRRIRQKAGVSLRRMGEELGVTAETVWNWENGQYGPSMENAAKYRKLLDELAKAAS